MTSRAVQRMLAIAAIGVSSAEPIRVRAQGGDAAALALALTGATTTLRDALKTIEREETPISAKFEIEDARRAANSMRRSNASRASVRWRGHGSPTTKKPLAESHGGEQ